ncbi:nucleotide exchange factor GrpE [bacterium F11]|nr:nucleotide exchange factor GrpE [bacterium F11]
MMTENEKDRQEISSPLDRPDLEEKLTELEILRQSLEEKSSKLKETNDQFLRLGADFQNYRKRAEARVVQSRQFGKEEVLLQILSLSDSLLHAVDASEKATDLDALKKGLALVNQQFEKFLKDHGVRSIPTEGEKLDPHKHEALAQEENESVEDGIIVGEIQRGFMMGDQVLRTAKVRVATKKNQEAEKGI